MYVGKCNNEVNCQVVIDYCKNEPVNPIAVPMVSKENSKANSFHCLFPEESKDTSCVPTVQTQ